MITSDQELLSTSNADYMNADQLAYFRKKLLEEKAAIQERMRATTDHLQQDHEVISDPSDRASQEEAFALELRTRDRERKLIPKIDQAIRMIDDGTYGYCADTGEEIGLARLLIRPTATLSLEAQERREKMKTRFAD